MYFAEINLLADGSASNPRDPQIRRPDLLQSPLGASYGYPRGVYAPKKGGYWVSKRIRGVQNQGDLSDSPECQSDNSSNSTVASTNTEKATKRLHEVPSGRVTSSRDHFSLPFSAQPHSAMYNGNKRRYSSVSGYAGRTGTRVYPHLHPHLHPHRENPGWPGAPSPAVHHIAPDRFLMKAHLVQVKHYCREELSNNTKWDTLSHQIWDKFIHAQQTEDTYRRKMSLWKCLYLSIKNVFPRYSLYIVGSTVSGLGANDSDMDLCLWVKCHEPLDNRSIALYHLDVVYRFIKSIDIFSHAELIKAKVPILKFKDVRFSLEVDLNCNNVVGIRNTHLLHCYSQLDWRVKPLVLIVKLWAKHHNINDAKNKTISSYSLVLMVIHYLQCGTQPAILPCLQSEMPDKFSSQLEIPQIDLLEEMAPYPTENHTPLGELLRGFFDYYTNFNYSRDVVSVRTGSCLSAEKCRETRTHEPHQWKLLCVEEPFDLSNTARSVYDPDVFAHISKVFKESLLSLDKTPSISSIFSFNLVE